MDRIDIAKVLLEHEYDVLKSSLQLIDFAETGTNWRAVFQGDTVYVVLYEREIDQFELYKISKNYGHSYTYADAMSILVYD